MDITESIVYASPPLADSTAIFALRVALMDPGSDSVTMSWEAAQMAARASTNGAVRRHLSRLKKRGFIHYSTNAQVYVNWLICDPNRITRDPNRITHAPNRITGGNGALAESDHPRAESDHQRSGSDHPRAESDHFPPIPPNRLVGGGINTNNRNHLPTGDEIDASVEMLTDDEVGVSPGKAYELAQLRPMDFIARSILAWMAEPDTGAGALVNRIKNGWQPGQLILEDTEREFYRRHEVRLAPLFEDLKPTDPASQWAELTGQTKGANCEQVQAQADAAPGNGA